MLKQTIKQKMLQKLSPQQIQLMKLPNLRSENLCLTYLFFVGKKIVKSKNNFNDFKSSNCSNVCIDCLKYVFFVIVKKQVE